MWAGVISGIIGGVVLSLSPTVIFPRLLKRQDTYVRWCHLAAPEWSCGQLRIIVGAKEFNMTAGKIPLLALNGQANSAVEWSLLDQRWGNRPAGVSIAGDFGCCASG